MQSGTNTSYSQRNSCARFFWQIYSTEGLRGLYRVSVSLTLVYVVPGSTP